MTTHGERNHGRGTSVPILPPQDACGPLDHTDILLSVRSLTRCPLVARPLEPFRGHRNPTRNLCSGRAWNRPPFIKVCSGPTRNTRSSMTHYPSHMPTLTRSGNKAAPMTSLGRGNLCHTTRIPRDRGTRFTEQPSMPTTTNWPGQCTRSLGPPSGPLPHVATPDPAFAGHPLGSTSMGLCAGNLAGQQPPAPAFSLGAHQRLWPWNHYGLPTTVRNPSASDSSAAEGNPSDQPPRSRSRGKRHHREAPSSSSKRPRPATLRLAVLIIFLRVRECRFARHTPPPPPTPPPPHSLSHGQRRLVHPPRETSTSDKEVRFWPSSPRDQEGERPESLSLVEEERDDSFASVIDLIRRYHNLEKPAGVTPARGLTTLGLQAEASPALHLPPSRLVKALVDKVNSTFDKFVEEQTRNAFMPRPVKRQWRYYRTSKPLFAGP